MLIAGLAADPELLAQILTLKRPLWASTTNRLISSMGVWFCQGIGPGLLPITPDNVSPISPDHTGTLLNGRAKIPESFRSEPSRALAENRQKSHRH
jgi:hypothetical protein